MKKTITIQNGLTVICGPTASGKTTLAQHIIKETPYHKKCLLSIDAEAKKFLHEVGLPEELLHRGLDQATHFMFQDWLTKKLVSAFDEDSFVVYEGVCERDSGLLQGLRLFPLTGFCRPITLIKIFPDLTLHTEFAKKRLHSELPVSPQEMLLQRNAFHFLAEDPLFVSCEWIREYLITDPTQVRLDFMKSGQCSKESLAAFMVYENSKFATSS